MDKNPIFSLIKTECGRTKYEMLAAKKGIFKEFNKVPVLVLYSGETIKGGVSGITNFSFAKSDFPLNNFKTNTTTYVKTQELSSLKLYKCINSIYLSEQKKPDENIENCSLKNLKNIYKEIYKRFIVPFYIPLLTLITFLLILSSKENSDYYKLKIFTFMFGLFFIIFSETTVRLISDNLVTNAFIAFMPYLSFAILYLFLFKKLNFKSLST